MVIIFPPEFECYVAFRTVPGVVLVLNSEMHGIFVPDHIPLFPKAFLTKITRPGFQFHVDSLLMSLQTKISPKICFTNITMKLSLATILMLVPDMSCKINHRFQTHRTDLLNAFMDRLHMSLQGLVRCEHRVAVFAFEHNLFLVKILFMLLLSSSCVKFFIA